jgi:hypothetical protein
MSDPRRAVDLLNEAQIEHHRVKGWAYERSGACGIVCACGWQVSMDGGILRDSVDWADAAWREHLSCAFLAALDPYGLTFPTVAPAPLVGSQDEEQT